MQDVIELARHENKLAHIGVMKLEVLFPKQVFNILERPGDEIIHGDDMVAFGQEPVAEMGT